MEKTFRILKMEMVGIQNEQNKYICFHLKIFILSSFSIFQ